MSPTAPQPDTSAREAARADASSCPLCGQANACAMESAKASGLPAAACWCVGASFAPALLARVPEALRNRACVCSACAAAGF
ncbi:MAG: cysteine-rich CWC family protein [Rhodoferax sp.]